MALGTQETSTYDAPTLEACQDLRAQEFEVLESIYPDYIQNRRVDGTLELEIPVEFSSSEECVVTHPSSSASSDGPTMTVTALPPVRLSVRLPQAYPLRLPPELLSITTTHNWFLDVGQLSDQLIERWEEGETILYTWIEYIHTGEFLRREVLGKQQTVILVHHDPHLLCRTISEYDASSKLEHFNNASYACSICLTSLRGSKCTKLACGHVFCRSCLYDFWSLCITEGDVTRVGCPDPACVKEGTVSSESDVAQVVSESELERWRWLRGKWDMEKDPTIVVCPRPDCQQLVRRPADLDTESGWDRFRQCSKCSFAFCSFCKRTWHGPVTHCRVDFQAQLVAQYLSTEVASQERRHLERQFGEKTLRILVQRWNEEQQSEDLIKSSTTQCPGCETRVEKSHGCNHMNCVKCKAHFCYRCGSVLQANNYYEHFNNRANSCYNKLFDFVQEE